MWSSQCHSLIRFIPEATDLLLFSYHKLLIYWNWIYYFRLSMSEQPGAFLTSIQAAEAEHQPHAPASSFPSCLLFLVPFNLSCHLSAPPLPHLPSPQPTPLPPTTPHRSLSAEQTASFPFPSLLSPLTPCSHAPLSRAAAVHKYINLLSACTCVRAYVEATALGRRRADGRWATRRASPLLCPITDAWCFAHRTRPASGVPRTCCVPPPPPACGDRQTKVLEAELDRPLPAWTDRLLQC